MNQQELKAELLALLNDKTLFEETQLNARKEALDSISYYGQVLQIHGWQGELATLYQQATELQGQFQAIDEALFRRVRAELLAGDYTREGLRTFFGQFTDFTLGQSNQPDYEYNSLDILLEQTILPAPFPTESRERTPGMIRYEATPARIILELVDQLHFTPQDTFVDLGSGLGLAVILVNLLTGRPSIGIEYDPVYCAYAQTRAAELGLTEVTFINGDARQADFSQGSIFYLFTPFINEVFEAVLDRLRQLGKRRPIYICSYGTCTIELNKLPWLQIRDPAMEHDFKLAIFSSDF